MKVKRTVTIEFEAEHEGLVAFLEQCANRDSRSVDHIINVALVKYLDTRDLR